MKTILRTRTAPVCAALLMIGGWYAAELPESSSAEQRLAQRFSFQKVPLNAAVTTRDVRQVAPAYHRIRHWMSSVGAGVALTDADGNGKPDDACLVDPRDDSVTLSPVPGTGRRYRPVNLKPAGLPYDTTMAPMGCVPADYNEDGQMDVLISYWGRSPVLFLRAPKPLGSPRAFAAQELVSPYQVWNTNTVNIADVDGDGHTDIVVGNYFPDGARVLDPRAPRQPELQMNASMSAAYNGGVNRVLLFGEASGGEHAKVRFHDMPNAFPDHIARGWTLASGAQDLDGDSRPELYLANDFGPDRLLRNLSRPGQVRFQELTGVRHLTTPKSQVLSKDSFKGMGVAFTHLNTDGTPDIVVSNITEPFALQESNFAWTSARRQVMGGNGTVYYDDHSERLRLSRTGWAWDIKAADFDANGRDEILQATGFVRGTKNRWPELQELAMTNDDLLKDPRFWPQVEPGEDLAGNDANPFLVRDGDGRFHDVAARIGVDDPGVSRGIAVGDVDHDGRLDFAVANQWRQSYFYRNTRGSDVPFLGLRLLRRAGACAHTPPDTSTAATTPAIGAGVVLSTAAGGVRSDQVYPANGHTGVSAPELFFGLRDVAVPVPATVTWRDSCGRRHSAGTRLTPGWHTLLLGADGSVQEVVS